MAKRPSTRMAVGLILGTWLGSLAAPGFAEPTADEQYWLQLVNRFRADPAGELDRMVHYTQPGTGTQWADPIADDRAVDSALRFFRTDPARLRQQFQALTPSPPLAWSHHLAQSAHYYSELMIDRDQQSHSLDIYTTPGYTLLDRFRQEGGYDFTGGGAVGENLFAFAQNIDHAHAAFLIDWGNEPFGIQDPPGHRDNLLSPRFREIGISVVREDNPSTRVGPLVVTQHLAVDFADGPFVTGAVYADHDGDQFYTPGEGIGDLQIQLVEAGQETPVQSSSLYDTGGYRLDIRGLPAGSYQVLLANNAPIYWSPWFTIEGTSDNQLLDIVDPQHDIDSLSRTLREGRDESFYDLNRDGRLDDDDRLHLIEDVYQTYLGDANLDGQFNSSDMILVFQAGQYEDDVPRNSLWSTGDWDGDGEFASSDVIVAFQQGGYERGPRAAIPVPEPAAIRCMTLLMLLSLAASRFLRDRSLGPS